MHPPLTLGKLDKPTFDDWVNAAAFVASHDRALFGRVMDKASKLAATFENSKPGIAAVAPVGALLAAFPAYAERRLAAMEV